MFSKRSTARVAAVFYALGLAACANVGANLDNLTIGGLPNDPYEESNRATFNSNVWLDKAIFKPVAEVYKGVVPPEGRVALAHALDNAKEPRNVGNHLLQGRPDRAAQSTARFVLNSTFGIGGLWDPAAKIGIPLQEADFGQTLGAWGVEPGAYAMLPLVGPSNTRDTIGMMVDSAADPISLFTGGVALAVRPVVGAVSQRAEHGAEWEAMQGTSIDPYSTLRSVYTQRREKAVQDARGSPSAAPIAMDYNDPAPKRQAIAASGPISLLPKKN